MAVDTATIYFDPTLTTPPHGYSLNIDFVNTAEGVLSGASPSS